MASRKWLIRSLYLAFLTAVAAGGLLLYSWMRPDFIRQEITNQLTEKLNNIDVELESAHLRILGDGISVTDLKLIHRDDPTRTPIFEIPSAILYYDKETLNSGKLVVRKVEMFKPTLRIERDADGKWNISDLLKPSDDESAKPIFVLNQATIIFIDRRLGDNPVAEWKDINATIINDPASIITFHARGEGKPTGPFTVEGQYDKRGGYNATLDLSNIPFNDDLAKAIAVFSPDAAEYAKPLEGTGSIHLTVGNSLGSSTSPYYDMYLQIHDGRYEHANLPLSLNGIELALRSKNGDITIEKATARAGQATISLTMDLAKQSQRVTTVAPKKPSAGTSTEEPTDYRSPLLDLEDRLRSLNVRITNLVVTPELFAALPGKAQTINAMFMPSGTLSLDYDFQRKNGRWQKNLVARPLNMVMKYRGFPYLVRNIRGKVVHTVTETTFDQVQIDLKGEGAGATIGVTGAIKGTHPDIDVNLRIEGNGVTLDQELIEAMPDDNPDLMRRLHATAFGDFVALIRHNERTRQEYGPDVNDNEFTINVRDGSMKYESFPYPLSKLRGTLIVRTVPERPTQLPASSIRAPLVAPNVGCATLVFQNFSASNHGGRIRGSGRKDPAPGGSILTMSLEGESVALDDDLRQALAAIHVENSWKNIGPAGRMNCALRFKLFTNDDPKVDLNPAEDLELSIAFAGASIRPEFFPYQLYPVSGRVSYAKGRVDIRNIHANHGKSLLTLPFSEVLFRPSGGYWADIRELNVDPLVVDSDFLSALAPGLRSAFDGLELRGPLSLHATRLVLDEQPGPHQPRYLPGVVRGAAPVEGASVAAKPAIPKPLLPTIYWDGSITMTGASMNTGLEWEDIHGKFASWGLYKGDRFGAVRGNIAFDRASIARQPVEGVTAQLRIDPRQPDVVSIPALHGKLYGGDLGGEAWVVLDSPIRYALQINAARVRLSEIARQYKLPAKVHLEGYASAQIFLTNRNDERSGLPVLQGGGTLDMPNGKLLNLPVLLNLIKIVKLRIPDETGFEEAHALFYIRDNQLKFGQLDLIGNAVSLGGEGEMNLDGSGARFEFYPVWMKVKEMFPLPGNWTGAISKKFLKIKVTGDLDGKLEYKAEPVPGIVEPVKRVLDRIKAASAP